MRLTVATAAAVFVSACAGPPALTVGPDPSDPGLGAPPLHYMPVTGEPAEFAPVEPRPWAEQNRRVAPQPRTTP